MLSSIFKIQGSEMIFSFVFELFLKFQYLQLDKKNMFGGGQNNNMSFGGWWKDLLIGFKYLMITTIGFGLFSIIFGGLFIKIFINYMPLTVYNFQIWRLFTSFLVDGSILQVLFCLYLLHQIIIELQKRYSTSYIILELFIQTLLCNSILYAVAIPLNLLGVIQEQYVMTFGMIHLLFIFLWKKAAQNPQSQTTFCCFPCLIPMKNLPWVYLIFFMLLGGGNIGSLIGCLVGYYQHMYLKRSLLQIRLAHYKKIQSWLPNSMKQQPSFVKISQTQTLLRTVCRQHIEPPFLNSNPFNNNRPAPQHSNPYQLQQPMNDKIQVTGKGVPIGSSSPTEAQPSNIKSYKDRWTKQTQVSQRPQNLKNNIQDQIRSQNSFNQKDQPDMNESMMSEKPLNIQDEQDLSDNSDKNLKKNGLI